jgi:hypothetical protein
MNNEPEEPTGVIIPDRGMNRDECRTTCTSPQIPLREKLFFRMIYEITTQGGPGSQDRAVEPHHRRDHLPQDQEQIQPLDQAPHAQDHESDRQYQCSEMLRHYVGNRKKGHIFMNVRTEKRLTLRHFEKIIDKWARLLNIQKLQSIKPSGREYHLIILMGPKGDRREAP